MKPLLLSMKCKDKINLNTFIYVKLIVRYQKNSHVVRQASNVCNSMTSFLITHIFGTVLLVLSLKIVYLLAS